jgi:hypothetical protein
MPLIVEDLRQVFKIARLSRLVEIEQPGLFPREPLQNEIGVDEAGAVADENQDDLPVVMSNFFMGSLRAAVRNE